MMWEKKQISFMSQWVNLLRGGVFLLLITLITAFLNQTPVLAADYKWDDDKISFEQKIFTKRKVQDADPDQTYYFSYEGKKAHALIFSGDPKAAKEAEYLIYDVTDDQKLTNPQSQEKATLSISPTAAQKTGGSCQVEGIGWIICPLFNFLSKGMDAMYEIVSDFITLKPLSTDKNSTLAQTWEIIRNIANSLFSIVFLAIIGSYLTGRGLSNYNIKKMLPKLIISALLVNLSFYICVWAVDLSNIIGASITNIFKTVQAQTMNTTASATTSWTDLGSAVLQGGTLIAATGAAVYFGAGGLMASLFMLVPALIGAAISLIATIVVLSARQAIIIALVIVSPLAFIAYTLPNTEQYFKKWLELLKSVLFLQPIFVLLYNAAQIASLILLLNATNGTIIIIGMVVQVVPLIMLPKLARDSNKIMGNIGNALNKFTNPINNSAKTHFGNRQAAAHQKWLAGDPSAVNLPRRLAQFLDREKQLIAEKNQAYDSLRKSNYITKKANATRGSLYKQRLLDLQAAEENSDAGQRIKTQNDIVKAEIMETARSADSLTDALDKISKDKRKLAKAAIYNKISQSEAEMAADKNKMEFIKLMQKDIELDDNIYDDKHIQKAMTGVYNGTDGSTVAISAKISAALRKEHDDSIKAIKEMFASYKLNDDQIAELAFAKANASGQVSVVDANGNSYTFDSVNDKAVLEAAVATIIGTRNVSAITEIVNQTGQGGRLHEIAPAIGEIIRSAGLTQAAGHLGRQYPDIIARGLANEHHTFMYQLNDLIKGRYGKEAFAVYDKDYTDLLTKAIDHHSQLSTTYADEFDINGKFLDPQHMEGFGKFTIDTARQALIKAGGQAKNALLDPELERRMSSAQHDNIIIFLKKIDSKFGTNLIDELNKKIITEETD
ncbi:MAG: hypothetical protein Q3996_00400 [Candidatus Saccharibacteria bacterium]|nr:hypothetical protein [Candidatus Saccharibacteria bacterium]